MTACVRGSVSLDHEAEEYGSDFVTVTWRPLSTRRGNNTSSEHDPRTRRESPGNDAFRN